MVKISSDEPQTLYFKSHVIKVMNINNCPTRCNTKQSIYYSASSLYMFRVPTTPITRSTQNCNYSLRYWSNVLCSYLPPTGTVVTQWVRCCGTNRKVAGSIPPGVIGFFIDIKSFRSHYGPGLDSASNRNEYQEYFLGVEAAGAQG